MSAESVIRTANYDDVPALYDIWRTSFGDGTEAVDAFFRHFYKPERVVTAECDGRPVSAGYFLPIGTLRGGQSAVLCSYIYAVATLPEYRGRGLGGAVTGALVKTAYDAGFGAAAICPASDTLFEYYNTKIGFREFFYMREFLYETADFAQSTGEHVFLEKTGEREYADFRESLLKDTVHIDMDLHAVSYQKYLCETGGGGLFTLKTREGARACVTVERRGGEILVKELLVSGITERAALRELADVFPAARYRVRTPLPGAGECKKRFAMLITQENFQNFENPGWFSMAFD